VTATAKINCPTCGATLSLRNRPRLILAGLLFVALACAAAWEGGVWLWALACFLALIGAYLLVWGIWAKGLWCRTCKAFPLSFGT
jgi:hypothetical protein